MQPIINTNIRKDKEKDGKVPIILQLYHKGKRRQVFTGLYVKETDFKDGKVINIPNKAHYNQLLINKRNELEREYLTQAVTGEINLTERKQKKEQYFFAHAKKMIEELKLRCKPAYIKRYEYFLRDFKLFAGEILIKDVDHDLLKSFESHLFNKGMNPNTIGRSLKKIKQVLNHYGSPIKFKTITYKQPKREYLTLDEIKKIEKTDYNNIVKWYFLLSCYTGIRYSDCNNVKSKVVDNNGKRLILSTSKTGEIISVKLSNNVLSIIDKLNEPIPANQHCNRVLKELAVFAKIDKNLTFHMARHSFAVNSASLGFPVEIVSRLLGHSSIRTTQIYYRITDNNLDSWMDKWDR